MTNSQTVRSALDQLSKIDSSLRGLGLTPNDADELYLALSNVTMSVRLADRTHRNDEPDILVEAAADRVAINPYKLTADLLKVADALQVVMSKVITITDDVLPPE